MTDSSRTATQIDDELGAAVQRRDAARREISKHSATVVNSTREIDQLLAERTVATMPQVPDSPAGIELPPRPAMT